MVWKGRVLVDFAFGDVVFVGRQDGVCQDFVSSVGVRRREVCFQFRLCSWSSRLFCSLCMSVCFG